MKIAMANNESIGRSSSRSNSSTSLGNNNYQFPSKLYEMLESVDSLGLSHIVSWLPNGRSFHVIDPNQFMDLVVPQFFKATKYRSFQRQLNLWGFRRIKNDQNDASWNHEHDYFIRGRPELIPKITRTRIKGKGVLPQAARKPHTAHMQTHSEGSAERARSYDDYFDHEEDGGCDNSDSTRKISNTRSDVIPALFKDEVFDEKLNAMFSERGPSQSQNTGYMNIEQMCLEPLPIGSAGILDSPDDRNNSDLVEFGQLLGRL
eukprot:scaffold22095_cov153-Skeletonema_dohrnii-CCMP3373.AAC.4